MAAKKTQDVNEVTENVSETVENVDETVENVKKKAPEAAKEETVRFIIPKGTSDRDKGDLFVAVNGKSYLVKRGVAVDMPRSVAEVLENSSAQLAYAEELQKKLENQELEVNAVGE